MKQKKRESRQKQMNRSSKPTKKYLDLGARLFQQAYQCDLVIKELQRRQLRHDPLLVRAYIAKGTTVLSFEQLVNRDDLRFAVKNEVNKTPEGSFEFGRMALHWTREGQKGQLSLPKAFTLDDVGRLIKGEPLPHGQVPGIWLKLENADDQKLAPFLSKITATPQLVAEKISRIRINEIYPPGTHQEVSEKLFKGQTVPMSIYHGGELTVVRLSWDPGVSDVRAISLEQHNRGEKLDLHAPQEAIKKEQAPDRKLSNRLK